MVRLLLRFFFHLLYHGLAWAYDLVALVVSLGRWYRWTHAVIPFLQGERILEMGYGTGHLQQSLLQQGYQCFGLDESRQMAAISMRRLRRAAQKGEDLRAGLVRARGDAIPFPIETFDSIVATFPAPYIAQAATVAELARVLRSGGRLVILLAAYHTGQSIFERAQAWLFSVTGESPLVNEAFQARLLAPYTAAGFAAQIRWEEVPGNRLLLILAEKTSAESNYANISGNLL